MDDCSYSLLLLLLDSGKVKRGLECMYQLRLCLSTRAKKRSPLYVYCDSWQLPRSEHCFKLALS